MFMMSVVAVLWRWTDADADLCHHSHRVINRRWIRGRVPKGYMAKRKTFFRAYIREEEEDKRVFSRIDKLLYYILWLDKKAHNITKA